MGYGKSSSKGEVYSNTTLPQEKNNNNKKRQIEPNLTPKTTG